MIFDKIQNLKKYAVIIPYVDKILEFIAQNDCLSLLSGEIEIWGRNLFVRINEYPTAPQTEKRFENHQIYADVQYVIQGVEVIGFTSEQNLMSLTAYDEVGDIQFFKNPSIRTNLVVVSGDFVVFTPLEAHQPGCQYQNSEVVKKLVFKIRMV